MFVHQLETWWEDVAYLSSRSPSAPTINIGGPLPITDIWPAQEGTQIKRAALMIHATLQNWQRLYRLVNKYTSTLIQHSSKVPFTNLNMKHLCL